MIARIDGSSVRVPSRSNTERDGMRRSNILIAGLDRGCQVRVAAYLDSAGGGFSCGNDIAPGHHRLLALAGSLVERWPTQAADPQPVLDEDLGKIASSRRAP
jgi:hypothetical protein